MALSFFDAILESKHYNSIYIKYAVYCFKPILIKRIPKLAIELLYINHWKPTSRDKTKHTHFPVEIFRGCLVYIFEGSVHEILCEYSIISANSTETH